MSLQDGNHPASRRQGAVQGRYGAGAALTHVACLIHGVRGALADVQAARLVGGAVRGGGQLAVGALGGDPRLAVELAGCGGAQVACGGVNHAVCEAAALQHFLFEGQQLCVHLFCLLDGAVDEHFSLVELVHANDAAGVLTCGACLAAVAGGPAQVLLRTLLEVENFVGVVAGERHLGGADQVQVVAFEAVDFVVVLDVEAGAVHDFGAYQGGGGHHGEAVLGCEVERHPHECLLQACYLALEEVEACAGDLRAACHVDAVDEFADFEVVARFEAFGGEVAGGADFLDDYVVVFAADGYAVDDEVFDAADQFLVFGGFRFGGCLCFVDAGCQFLRLCDEGGLFFLGCLCDGLAEGVLFGAQGLVFADECAACGVGFEDAVDVGFVLAACSLGGAEDVGVFAEEVNINHCFILPNLAVGCGRGLRWWGAGRCGGV